MVVLIGESNFPLRYVQSEALPSSELWHVIIIRIEFLRSFLRRDFASKPAVPSQNVGCQATGKHSMVWITTLPLTKIWKKLPPQLYYVDQNVCKTANNSASIHTNQIRVSSNRLKLSPWSLKHVFKKIKIAMRFNFISKRLPLNIRGEPESSKPDNLAPCRTKNAVHWKSMGKAYVQRRTF